MLKIIETAAIRKITSQRSGGEVQQQVSGTDNTTAAAGHRGNSNGNGKPQIKITFVGLESKYLTLTKMEEQQQDGDMDSSEVLLLPTPPPNILNYLTSTKEGGINGKA